MDSVFIPVIIVVIILLLFAFAVILNHEVYQYMLKASPTLAALTKLNASFFPQLAGSRGQVYNIHIKAKSKAQFDAHTIEHACSLYLLGHYKAYKPICLQYKRDEATYRDYMVFAIGFSCDRIFLPTDPTRSKMPKLSTIFSASTRSISGSNETKIGIPYTFPKSESC